MSGPTDRLSRHPYGTLAIVATYGLLHALGRLAVYVFVYVPARRVSAVRRPMRLKLYEKVWVSGRLLWLKGGYHAATRVE